MSLTVSDILSEHQCRSGVSVSSKKKLFEMLSTLSSELIPNASADDIYERLLNRERLGSTGFGQGIAIPHCRLLHCHNAFGILLTLNDSIDFDSVDNEPVDIVFALFVPEEATDEHLQVLATLAQRFNEAPYRAALRDAENNHQLFTSAIT